MLGGVSVNIPLPKLKAIVLYFSTNTDTKFLGKVKLMKLIYFLDFTHLKKYGSPITYDTYYNLQHGPIPSSIKNLIDDAAEDIDTSVLADTIRFERPSGTRMYRILPTRKLSETDIKYFSKTELDILKQVCLRFADKNTQYIVNASHKEAPWRETEFRDKIPYELAAEDEDAVVDKEEIKLLLEIT